MESQIFNNNNNNIGVYSKILENLTKKKTPGITLGFPILYINYSKQLIEIQLFHRHKMQSILEPQQRFPLALLLLLHI